MDLPKRPCADPFLSHDLRSVLSGRGVGGNTVKPAGNAELYGRVRVAGSELFLLSSWTQTYHRTCHTAQQIVAIS